MTANSAADGVLPGAVETALGDGRASGGIVTIGAVGRGDGVRVGPSGNETPEEQPAARMNVDSATQIKSLPRGRMLPILSPMFLNAPAGRRGVAPCTRPRLPAGIPPSRRRGPA